MEATARQMTRLRDLQDRMWAEAKHSVLVVLQGTDTAGKDGTIRGVFGQTSALGVNTVAWKAPSEDERAHDYLWRIHQEVPRLGQFVIFNRSHYEDVLVPVVKGWIDKAETRQRYAHINDFERMLCETGTVVLKFLLHISKEEQRLRLQERLDDPTKHWKFAAGDLEVRKPWDTYQAAFDEALSKTSTAWAPWYVIPANRELVPQPRGVDDPRRHHGRAEAGLPGSAGPASEPRRRVGAASPPAAAHGRSSVAAKAVSASAVRPA